MKEISLMIPFFKLFDCLSIILITNIIYYLVGRGYYNKQLVVQIYWKIRASHYYIIAEWFRLVENKRKKEWFVISTHKS